ncbi:MAG TPA: response regulator [Anaeromyxobacter sp.]|nr:response regulator [Anaeromyxobacter sp.]
MPKKILLIENDSSFAAGISESLETSGFEVRVTGDGKEGLDLAREWSPEAVVLCVELPGMSGYLVCQKLKKDDALKALPLVLTSAEATEETFEKHRTLKARADEYLLKPYAPAALVEKLGALVGLPETAAAPAEEEIVSLEEEVGVEGAVEGSPDRELPGLDLESLPDEPPASAGDAALEDDLKLLDEAFDGIAAPAPKDAAAALDELTGENAAPEVEADELEAPLPEDDEGAIQADSGGLDAEAEAALGALGGADETLSPGTSVEPEPPTRPIRGASAELLRAAGVKLLSDEEPPPRAGPAIILPAPSESETFPGEAAGAEIDSGDLRGALDNARAEVFRRDAEIRDLEGKLRDAERRAGEAEGEADHARSKADGLSAQLRKVEADVRAARDEARRAADQAKAAEAEAAELGKKLADVERRAETFESDLRRKAEEAAAAAEAIAKAEALEREADELRTELLVARSEAEGARNEVEKRTAELKKRVGDVESSAQKNEERVVKAYQKIKGDEKVREKVRKALAIAMQLLDEGLPTESAAEKERRAASGGGRE